jgi:uridine kinase
MMDLKVYVDTQMISGLSVVCSGMSMSGVDRSTSSSGNTETVRPMHNQFVEPTKKFADVIIPDGGYNAVGIDLISGRIQAQVGTELAVLTRTEQPVQG